MKGRTRYQKPAPPVFQVSVTDDLGLTLDALNAWGCLENWKEADLKHITCFGPGVFRGYLPSAWVGVILWYKPRGYYHYKTLSMVGVWAVREGESDVRIIAGTKQANYAHPIYNAEGYFRRMQSEFRTFYKDDGSPPVAERHYEQVYDPARRLEMRQSLERILKSWAQAHH